MNFADKYEILNQIPAGKVDSYVAKDLETGERVLLHVFETNDRRQSPVERFDSEQDPPSPKTQETLNAPKAPNSGLEPSEKYTYSVTDSKSLHTWSNYSGLSVGDNLPREQAFVADRNEPTPSEPPSLPDLNATAIHTAVLSKSSSQPGEFTRQFFALPEQELQRSRSNLDEKFQAVPGKGSTAPAFLEIPSSKMSGQDDTEGFTSFFQGPFHGKPSLDTPALTQNVSAKPTQKEPGEFTKVFGNDSKTCTDPQIGQRLPKSRGGDAEIFGLGLERNFNRPLSEGPPTPLERDFQTAGRINPAGQTNFDTTFEMSRVAQNTIAPFYSPELLHDSAGAGSSARNHSTPPSFESEFDRGKSPAMATEIFAGPRRDPPQAPPPIVAGPGEYTQIIRLNNMSADVDLTNESKPNADPGRGPAGSPSSLPGLKAPITKMPQPTALKTPAAPASKQLGVAKGSIKPIYLSALPIFVLSSALLLISLAMALYFILRH